MSILYHLFLLTFFVISFSFISKDFHCRNHNCFIVKENKNNCNGFIFKSIFSSTSIRRKSRLSEKALEQTMSEYLIDLKNCEDNHLIDIIFTIATSCKEISKILSTITITGLTGSDLSEEKNFSGDKKKKVDVVANELIQNQLLNKDFATNNNLYAILSEENDDVIYNNYYKQTKDYSYVVTFDPLDGSSNIDCSIPTGTIFGIYKVKNNVKSLLSELKGSNIVAAGYALYSSSTELVISHYKDGNKICNAFTLNPSDESFYLTRQNIICPKRGVYYSLNEARQFDWPIGLQLYINSIKNGLSESKKRYSLRYVCSLVADYHRTLLYGGWAGNPRYHLRLLYEAAPLSFIAYCSEGIGSDGVQRILDIVPISIHQKTPLFIGSELDILEIESYTNIQQKEIIKYEN